MENQPQTQTQTMQQLYNELQEWSTKLYQQDEYSEAVVGITMQLLREGIKNKPISTVDLEWSADDAPNFPTNKEDLIIFTQNLIAELEEYEVLA